MQHFVMYLVGTYVFRVVPVYVFLYLLINIIVIIERSLFLMENFVDVNPFFGQISRQYNFILIFLVFLSDNLMCIN